MYLQIKGGNKLNGQLDIMAAKNSILPIIAACVLTKQTVVLKNCPPLLDIYAMLDIIRSIGGSADFTNGTITINCRDASPAIIDQTLTQSIRSSIFILGPIISRFKRATISSPGGCEIGKRPIDLHIDGLSALGVKTEIDNGIIDCDGASLRSGKISLRVPSVGATENIMMAAVLALGRTEITNAAAEPEIVDLANFINMLGGRVFGAGSSTIIVDGVKSLGGGEYTPIPDRIVAGSYLAAAAVCGGKVTLCGVNVRHIYSTIDKIQKAGCRFNYKPDAVTITSGGAGRLRAIRNTATMPYPGFPTDMQAQLVSMLSLASGTSILTETLFESRFKYTSQLKKMGADIVIDGNAAIINGVAKLRGARLEAQDLRGGAALVIAALAAEGESSVHSVHHIDRGYYKIEEDLNALGANIVRIN